MKLKLSKPIIFFDLETTGVDVAKDRIVELCYIKVFPNGNEESKSMRINPGMPIPKASTEVHGITDADVADCPKFSDIADDLYATFDGCDLAGFNSNKFDIPLLCEEFFRLNMNFDISKCKCVDVQNIYHKLERRTLVAAYKYYCGKDLENAHSAFADTRATLEVLEAQLDKYPEDLKNDISFLSEYSKMNNNADFAGRMIYDENGEVLFNFGKHKGRKVVDVLRIEPSYYNWMMQGDFPQNTKQVLQKVYLTSKNKRTHS
ncbi:MAG: 3'-5' exonuclease [Prevotellaceae bacterium]|nr:3'-5' exonuclease [Candidatus Minthosoma caballi]